MTISSLTPPMRLSPLEGAATRFASQAARPDTPRFGSRQDSPQKPAEHPDGRRVFYGAAIAINSAVGVAGALFPPAWALYGLTLPLTAVGIHDLVQKKHALRRNFPLLARGRWMAESIRPEIRQYFIESDTDGKPFSREQRETVYKRATKDNDTLPFGTKTDVYAVGHETLFHAIQALPPPKTEPRILIGGPDCKQPYAASLLNVSAMSYGSLSKNAVLALNHGAHLGGFYQNTGEGGISPYHLGQDKDIEAKGFDYDRFIDAMLQPGNPGLKEAGDLVWQIGSGYFGCRHPDGSFNAQEFARKAALEPVKMIELKLSQGAKAGHGGVLPAAKVSPGIAKLRGVQTGQDCISPPAHSAFSTPRELMQLIQQMRDLAGGKPVGFKLCVGKKHEFLAICKAMLETGITPDFITVDGSEGGTGAAPREFSASVGLPAHDGLLFVHNALVGTGLRDKIKLIAAGKIIDGFDIARKLARGADLTNSARGMMFSVGCIQALKCHTNTCPTGVATQNPHLAQGLDPANKGVRAFNFQQKTLKNFMELLGAAGLQDPQALSPEHLYRQVSPTEAKSLSEVYEFLTPGALLSDNPPASFAHDWQMADPDQFSPKQ